jgi:hypothetical protein
MADQDQIQLSPGVKVVDMNRQTVGRIRAVYPHYIAVDGEGTPPVAFRVPPHTFVAFDGVTLSLSVPITALDEMTPPAETIDELPRHGGPLPQD